MKIFQQKLQILEKQIRKNLPRLLEFREGLILKRKVYHKLYSDYIMIKTIWDDVCTYVEIVEPIHKGNFSDNINNLLENFEIIGHDILLSDVLEWIAKQNEGLHLDIEYEVKDNLLKIIVMQDIDEIYSDFSKRYTECYIWDLSKISLADQSDELKEFLYELIDEEDENY